MESVCLEMLAHDINLPICCLAGWHKHGKLLQPVRHMKVVMLFTLCLAKRFHFTNCRMLLNIIIELMWKYVTRGRLCVCFQVSVRVKITLENQVFRADAGPRRLR